MTGGFNKAFESKVRLGMMSLLMVHSKLEFNELKEMLDVTDGNLARHAAAIEKLGYVEVRKQLKGKKFRRQHPIADYVLDFYCHECILLLKSMERAMSLEQRGSMTIQGGEMWNQVFTF